MTDRDDGTAKVAERYRLSRGAVQALADALRAGQGGAQWNHPDLGGMGQWFRGGMLQIGDMFNNDLKARVGAALEELAGMAETAPSASQNEPSRQRDGRWWPSELGSPSSTGAQNAMRYACFPDRKRLVVEQNGRTTIYDTGVHRLTGFAQAQGGLQTLIFSGPDGRVALDDLAVVQETSPA